MGLKIRLSAVLLGCIGTLAAPAYAQNAAKEAQNKLLAKRAAEADCFRKLAETVYGLKLSSDTYVRDFVTESDEIRTSVNEFVKGVRLGPPRYYEDGSCEVDGEVSVAKLITKLKELHSAYYKGNTVHTTDFEEIKQSVKTDVIRVTGMGAPRPEVAPGFEDAIDPLPPGFSAPLSLPDIWKSVPPQARLGAIRAAEVDAQRRLLERIKGLRLNSNTLVRDFVTESDEITTHSRGIVIGAQAVSKFLHDNELIVEVTVEVPVEKVFTKIKELHTAYYKGDHVTTTDIVNVKKTIRRKMIRETGMGVPNSRFLDQARSAGVQMPEWMSRRISATGSGTDRAIQTAQGKLKAARAAELDAKRRLAEQIYGLTLSGSTTVRDFVTEHDEVKTQVNAIFSGAIVGPPEYHGDMAEVTVSMPASEVWSVINQYTVVERHRG
ncbi:MAG: hypothetical protein ACE5E5_10665 [Phycisphaerae bacterium]